MLTFHGGPANGVQLSLRRAPLFLRVVRDPGGQWDALDQLADKPTPEESIWVYQLRDGGTARGMVCSRGQGCRTVIVADYDWLNEQPDDETLRDQDQWRAWASAQVGRRADASDEGPH